MGGYYPTPKPGPRDGSQRPAGAPNNGSMGGRPAQPVADASPMERLATAPPDPSFYPRTLPSPSGTLEGGVTGAAPAPSPTGGVAPPPTPGASPAAPPASGSTININVGGGGQSAGGEMWPDAQAKPSTAGGEMWPDARGGASPGADPANPTNAGGEMWPDATAPAPPPPVQLKKSPSTDDLARIPDGSEVVTPYATGTKRNGEVAEYHLTPAGQEAHKRATLALRERAGATPFDGDPTAPPILPLVLGKWNYNPWANGDRRWFK